MIRRIAHLDMDAFYASVELLRYPELRGRPVVVGGGRRYAPEPLADGSRRFARLAEYAGRGVSTTATYEARAQGVNSGMPLARAARLCPQAVLLPADFDEYRKYSRLFKAAVREIAPTIEDRGIDEIYIDLSDAAGFAADGGRAAALRDQAPRARRDRPVVLDRHRAEQAARQDGLRARQARRPDADRRGGSRIAHLAACRHAASTASARRRRRGSRRWRSVRSASWRVPTRRCSSSASAAPPAPGCTRPPTGATTRAVVTRREPKSMSRETTFERDLHPVRDRERLSEVFTALCEQVAEDLRRKGYVGRTIGIKLRFDDFGTVTRDQSIESYTDDARAIRRAAGACLKRVALERRLRLLGVRVGALLPAAAAPPAAPAPAALSLFD